MDTGPTCHPSFASGGGNVYRCLLVVNPSHLTSGFPLLCSIFVLSNETVNIWSHLLGFLLFFSLGVNDLLSVLPASGASREDYVIYAIGLFCFQVSTAGCDSMYKHGSDCALGASPRCGCPPSQLSTPKRVQTESVFMLPFTFPATGASAQVSQVSQVCEVWCRWGSVFTGPP